MGTESDKTEVHQANNLSPAPADKGNKPTVGVDPAKKGADQTGYSVTLDGKVYHVTAKNAQEAGDKAKQLHKSKKEK